MSNIISQIPITGDDTLTKDITPDKFLSGYIQLLPLYISRGRPSSDTLNTYVYNIEAFIEWCKSKDIEPLAASDYTMRMYVNYLISTGLKDSSIAVKVVTVRTFFMIAKRLQLITKNPCEYIHVSATRTEDSMFYFFSVDQIGEICRFYLNSDDDFIRYRGLLVIYLMGVEGLRVVEVQRACVEDIDIEPGIMRVRGKGHTGIIYPSPGTMDILAKYLQARSTLGKEIVSDDTGTPLIISASNFNRYKRISRNCIRKNIINPALESASYKMKGQSCHIFRHSCGTNLYQQTKDLRIVQEQLRQRDPKVTARYAHVHEKMSKRITAGLDPLAGAQ